MAASPRRRKYPELKADNVLREDSRAVHLRCGHATRQQPLAVLGSRRLFVCPQGCEGLQEPKR